jgi:hypothetical protein
MRYTLGGFGTGEPLPLSATNIHRPTVSTQSDVVQLQSMQSRARLVQKTGTMDIP